MDFMEIALDLVDYFSDACGGMTASIVSHGHSNILFLRKDKILQCMPRGPLSSKIIDTIFKDVPTVEIDEFYHRGHYREVIWDNKDLFPVIEADDDLRPQIFKSYEKMWAYYKIDDPNYYTYPAYYVTSNKMWFEWVPFVSVEYGNEVNIDVHAYLMSCIAKVPADYAGGSD